MLLLSNLPMSDYNEGISYHVLFVLDDVTISAVQITYIL